MAARSIPDARDRLTTILIAPLMTCSARLPVYAVIIAAVIPETSVGPGIGLQGLVLFVLYLAGIVGAMVVALVLRSTVARGAASGFIMEMPRYQLPRIKDLAIGLWQRAWVFLRRAGKFQFGGHHLGRIGSRRQQPRVPIARTGPGGAGGKRQRQQGDGEPHSAPSGRSIASLR